MAAIKMKKILVWGTGKIASEIYANGLRGEILGFIETYKKQDLFNGITVYGVDEKWPEYDYVVVANNYSEEIYKTCIEKDISLDNIIFMCAIKTQKKVKNDIDISVIHEILGEKNYTNYCVEYTLYNESFFGADCEKYEKLNSRDSFKIDRNNLWPVISDKYRKAGQVHNYFWQDLWAARLINKMGVKKHFDIGSRIDGFIAHLLAMGIDVVLIDIREFPEEVEGLHTIVDDATLLRQIPENSIESMSALCSLEHFGLGRYGDSIDPEACFKCFAEIQKRLKKEGDLYLSLPVGKERVEFNAHRIFYSSTILECFSDMELVEYSCTAAGRIEYNVDVHKYDDDVHDGEYRYGLFHFKKK